MSKKVVTRFAPSPTGFLHVGNIRIALINWLYTRSRKGKFILRIDDTDIKRSKTMYEEQIKSDLEWLGLYWDEYFRQSERLNRYEELKQKLIQEKRLYPCYESVEELAMQKKSLLSRNLPPVYGRGALKLTEKQKKQYEEQGIKPHWRFLLDKNVTTINDKVKGKICFKMDSISDPVLVRADGTMTYTLCSVVDDIDYQITHIIRGEDHLTNSAIHTQIFKALGVKKLPKFAHLCLLEAKDGEMSKRTGGFDILSMKEKMIEPMTINSFFAKIGTSEPVVQCMDLKKLYRDFAFRKFGKARLIYNENDIAKLNSKIVRITPYKSIKDRLLEIGLTQIDEAFWNAVRPNLNNICEIKDWWIICKTAIKPIILDIEFTKNASKLLPKSNWQDDIWDKWINLVQKESGRKGKSLYQPIRAALTGTDSGPELKVLLPMIGYNVAYARLNGYIR